MTPPDSGGREVMSFADALNVVAKHHELVALPLPLAQRILAALDYFAAEGWVAARDLASELRAAVERKP